MFFYLSATDIECSKCHALNNSELISKQVPGAIEMSRRCKICGHEKKISTTTTNVVDNQVVYSAAPVRENIVF